MSHKHTNDTHKHILSDTHTHTRTQTYSIECLDFRRHNDDNLHHPTTTTNQHWGGKEAFVRDKGLAHTKKNKNVSKPISQIKKRFEHIELPAKLLDYFSRSNKSNINQSPPCAWLRDDRLHVDAYSDIMQNTSRICYEQSCPSRHNDDNLHNLTFEKK